VEHRCGNKSDLKHWVLRENASTLFWEQATSEKLSYSNNYRVIAVKRCLTIRRFGETFERLLQIGYPSHHLSISNAYNCDGKLFSSSKDLVKISQSPDSWRNAKFSPTTPNVGSTWWVLLCNLSKMGYKFSADKLRVYGLGSV